MGSCITHNPDQCGGRPCIREMQIRVRVILELYAAGQSSGQILADFPDLKLEDLKATLAYAAWEIDYPVLAGCPAATTLPRVSAGSHSPPRELQLPRQPQLHVLKRVANQVAQFHEREAAAEAGVSKQASSHTFLYS